VESRGNVVTRIGITGGAGRIGRTLAEGLPERYEITLVDKKDGQNIPARFKFIQAELSEEEAVKGILEGLDAVIHLAANPSTRAPWESVLNDNIVATYNVFEEARRAGVRKLVFASTNHVQNGYVMGETPLELDASYVESHGLIRFDDPPAPDSLYGVSKLFGEDLGRYYARLFGIQFVALRLGWAAPDTAPPMQRGKANENHLRALFLSKRDSIQLVMRALEVDVDYLAAYGISDNEGRFFVVRNQGEAGVSSRG
jgi:nucleoside-diphosphate-sugar epimerase